MKLFCIRKTMYILYMYETQPYHINLLNFKKKPLNPNNATAIILQAKTNSQKTGHDCQKGLGSKSDMSDIKKQGLRLVTGDQFTKVLRMCHFVTLDQYSKKWIEKNPSFVCWFGFSVALSV